MVYLKYLSQNNATIWNDLLLCRRAYHVNLIGPVTAEAYGDRVLTSMPQLICRICTSNIGVVS